MMKRVVELFVVVMLWCCVHAQAEDVVSPMVASVTNISAIVEFKIDLESTLPYPTQASGKIWEFFGWARSASGENLVIDRLPENPLVKYADPEDDRSYLCVTTTNGQINAVLTSRGNYPLNASNPMWDEIYQALCECGADNLLAALNQ